MKQAKRLLKECSVIGRLRWNNATHEDRKAHNSIEQLYILIDKLELNPKWGENLIGELWWWDYIVRHKHD